MIYQRLTPYIWVGYDRTIDTIHFLCVARLLYALRLALDELQEWYSMAHAERIPRGIDMKKRILSNGNTLRTPGRHHSELPIREAVQESIHP